MAADTANPTVTVHFDASASARPGPFDHITPDSLLPWEGWAGPAGLRPFYPEVAPTPTLGAVGWTNGRDRAGLEIGNETADATRVRVAVHLSAGLWRIDAAQVHYAPEEDRTSPATAHRPARLWRMESVWLRDDGDAVKTLDLPAGETLFLRFTETIADADRARQAARRACWKSSNATMLNRVSPALEQVADTIDVLPDLVARGDAPANRDKVIKRVHTALLAVAKAQAVWQNWREDSASDGDAAFDALTRALSEVSCAACGLVPSETPLYSDGGDKITAIRLSVVNAGPRTIPLVSLGPARRTDGTPAADRTVFRDLAPGVRVSASYPAAPADSSSGDTASAATDALPPGVVQFIFGMGTAVVPARPEGPHSSPEP